ncbi:ribonuclease Z [Mesonia sp. HuA40]|uniref:ribonuclease Z n=1 Tax=Mesonia sp. HuA40 TaxID=2602761 RepID=UPI0011C7AF87|nr:ribonuclease Z [Mesonia sp. HuA40]TXK71097.1 ribonuclease Z [Mesonia sp. HuA40]
MIVENKENYSLLRDEKNDIRSFVSYLKNCIPKDFSNKNLVVDILKYGTLELEELLLFLSISNQHRKQKCSFVLVNDTIMIDRVPEELIVVPTLKEAADVIQMEEIERDLDAF